MDNKMASWKLTGFLLSILSIASLGYAQVVDFGRFEKRSMQLADFNKTGELSSTKLIFCISRCFLEDCNCLLYQNGVCSFGRCMDRKVFAKGRANTLVYVDNSVVVGCYDDSDCIDGEICGKTADCGRKREVALLISGSEDGVYKSDVEIVGECFDAIPPVSSYPLAVYASQAVVFAGLVHVCGGLLSTNEPVSDCYFRGLDGTWSAAPNMIKHRFVHSLTVLGDKIVASGGYDETHQALKSLETLTIGSDAWEMHSLQLPTLRGRHCSVAISSSEIVTLGGYDGNFLAEVLLLNLETMAKTELQNYPIAVASAACALDSVGAILVASGGYYTVEQASYNQAYTLDMSALSTTTTWVQIQSMALARFDHTMLLINGIFTVYGNATMEEYVNGAWQSSSVTRRNTHSNAILLC